MSRPIIEVSHLSKRYQLGAIGTTSLREETSRLWDRLRGIPHPDAQEFWALRDVSFEVQPGEVVGVIGRNGAGKSTLLKILSRITEPTSGRAVLRGRVASLLEVGTGFHPELTGRENVFLNGAILGMSRAEVRKKFDEIVAFAEVEQFIDTPVKRYSSGMYVRLAFAVAAHLEPEILIVDEVLAVGDANFQKKCLGKMEDVSRREGRTILMVSHNMSAARHLCSHGLYLDHGRTLATNTVEDCIQFYLRSPPARGGLEKVENRSGDGRLRFTEFFVENDRGERVEIVVAGSACTLVFGYTNQGCSPDARVDVGFGLHAPTGERLLLLYASHLGRTFAPAPAQGQFRCRLPAFPFATGRYSVYPRIEIGGQEVDFPRDGVGFIDVEEINFYGTGRRMGSHGHGHAYYLTTGEWSERAAAMDQRRNP